MNAGLKHGSGANEDDDDDRGRKKNNHNKKNNKFNDWKTPSPSKKSGKKKKETEAMTEDTATALTPMTAASVASTTQSQPSASQNESVVELDQRRDQLQHQMMLLSVTTMMAMSYFVVTLVPIMTLFLFGVMATSAGLLSYTAFQRLWLEYQEIVRTTGFARFLPPSLLQQLSEMSLHEYLMDGSFAQEWGFMALYFIPGLSEEQIQNYVGRLAPDHRQLLMRPGLGNFLGNSFMTHLLGENRWRQRAIEVNVPMIEHPNVDNNQQLLPASSTAPSRRLDFESDGESHASAPVGLTIEAASSNSHEVDESTTASSDEGEGDNNHDADDERQRQLAAESDLIMDALVDGVWSYATWAAGLAGELTYDYVVDPASSVVSYVGLGTSLLSFGIGFFGFSAGYYSRPSIASSQFQPASMLPSSRFLASTAILGGVSAGVVLFARSSIRNMVKPPPPPKGAVPKHPDNNST